MISQSEAYEIMMSKAFTLDSEQVDLRDALHRVLTDDVRSDMDMPPFEKSAMDGYACRREDISKTLEIVEMLKAGEVPTKSVGAGQCSKIMTGGMMPEGADCVVMVEKSEEVGENRIRFTTDTTPDNFCETGEDIQEGSIVLEAGTLLQPQHIAMLASVGCTNPTVVRQPRVGVIATGDELVEPEVTPSLSQIRTSNSHQLMNQVHNAHALPTYYGIARDTEESLDEILKKAIAENDLILLSGGVSMGDFDLVPGRLKANGLTILFDEIAVQPGKPTTFAIAEKLFCFGLPGNPVATFTQFEHLVKPLIYRLMGHTYRPLQLRLPMARKHTRKRAVRESWFLAKVTDEGTVLPVEFHGSAHVTAMCNADVMATMAVGVDTLEEGELVIVKALNY